ncbi:E3 ubiquitin-protein ligase TRIM11-like [Vombatus ursinus]|uniref:E3 ubiquitin-protein ligase TRIM11-like n=1 Tax=Vombatus ursinus TaxID=29139 RepID=UPI000FFD24E2|nr:E3 ubiquitin-protein ligase TRIM11-like [Vombatus ursinus]
MASFPELIENFQKELICSTCRDYLENPVSIECGHSVCHSCLLRSWQQASPSFSCPECRSVSQVRAFKVNVHLGKLIAIAKRLRPHCLQYPGSHSKCETHQKVQKLFCEDDQSPICMSCSESNKHKAHTLCCIDEAAEDIREKLQETVTHLWRKTENAVKQRANENIKFAQVMKVVLTKNDSVLQREIEILPINMTMYPIPRIIERIFNFKVNSTLDSNTAALSFIISEDLKSVRYGGVQEEVPNNSGRFIDFAKVLPTQSFISMRCYWEAEMPNNTDWGVGICKKTKDSQDFFMLVTVQKQNLYYLYTIAQHNFDSQVHKKYHQISVPSLKVGIFLDYERGEISFYHIKQRYLIYPSPSTSFSGLLTPFFCLSRKS